MQDTSLPVYAVLSKPSSVLGQAACKEKEKKKVVQDPAIQSSQMLIPHMQKNKPVLVSDICWVCVQGVHRDTHICVEISKYYRL